MNLRTKRAAVVVTTYNNPRALALCLESYLNQSSDQFDIFIADDGSTAETKVLIELFKPRFAGIVEHVWHPDQGYQKAKINNEVFRILKTQIKKYPVIICVDHDTIAHRKFVEDHLKAHQESNRMIFMGRRIDLSPSLSIGLDPGQIKNFQKGLSLELMRSAFMGETRNAFRALRIESKWLRDLIGRESVQDLLGSNFSISTSLMIEVNGYDEDFQSYWGEDGDLFIRVRNSGALVRGSKSVAIQYHIYHQPLEPKAEHVERYQKGLSDTSRKKCANGIEKLNLN
jgi:GT2 family glycosyltransferase